MTSRISVIIPFYNVREFLRDCIDSVLAQTINDMELSDGYERNLQIILVDDGSTDGSAEIARQYAAKHENIMYVYEENQGLGHARNYGCEFADADYIVFLDSDDMITPKAYERMYNASIKNKSDMTIGGILRFSSKGYWYTKIMEKTFSKTRDVTHITESTNLIYDTTAWNKLIKHSFWKEHDFRFPEGVLYEDIPVTVRMHHMANRVSIIYEPCYLWRVREGASKSISQTRTSLRNLNDRILAMKSIDGYFNDNVSQDDLKDAKNVKWLKLDLMLFINRLARVGEDDARTIMGIICDYIELNIDERYFDCLNEIERLKYTFLLKGDFERLLRLINFESRELPHLKAYRKDARLMVDVEKSLVEESSLMLNDYVRENFKRNYIQKMRFKKDRFILRGFTVIAGVEDDDFSSRQYSFYLVNSESHERIPLEYRDVRVKSLDAFNIPFKDSFSYNASGYEVYVPYEKIIDNEDFEGDNRILVTFRQDGTEYNYFAGFARRNVRSSSRFTAHLIKDNHFSIDFDLYNRLIFKVAHISPFSDISIRNSCLTINGVECEEELLVQSDEKRIPFKYSGDENTYLLDVDEIPELNAKIICANGQPAILSKKELKILESDRGVIVVNSLNDYNIRICRSKGAALISDISQKGDEITVNANVCSHHKCSKSPVLYIDCNKKIPISQGIISGDAGEVTFNFNLSDESITNADETVHEIYAEFECENGKFSTPLYSSESLKLKHYDGHYDYRIFISSQATLTMKFRRKTQ